MQFRDVRFPIRSVERQYGLLFHSSCIKTAGIDTETVRVRSRPVKRFNSANFAKQMIGHTRIESIRYQRVPPRNQVKARFGHDQMQITGQATD
jgi:hypothetical protein